MVSIIKYETLRSAPSVNTVVPRWDLGDFTGDGLLDVALHIGNPLAFRDSTPDAAATAPMILVRSGTRFVDGSATIFPAPFKTVNSAGLVSGDFNGDGKPDIAIGGSGMDRYVNGVAVGPWLGEREYLALSGSGGTLTDASTALPGPTDTFTHSISTADIDRDGDLDIYIGSISQAPGQAPYLLINSGTGGFTYRQDLLPAFVTTFSGRENQQTVNGAAASSRFLFTGSAFGDVNGDGAADLVLLPMSNTATGRVVLNPGNGNFAAGQVITLPPGLFGAGIQLEASGGASRGTTALAADIADFDGDGRNDLVIAETYSDLIGAEYVFYRGLGLQILVNRGASFVDETSSRISAAIPNGNQDFYYTVLACDISGDGRADIIAYRIDGTVFGRNQFSTEFYINDGRGHFERTQINGLPTTGHLIPVGAETQPIRDYLHIDYTLVGARPDGLGLWEQQTTLYTVALETVDLRRSGIEVGEVLSGDFGRDTLEGLGGADTLIGLNGGDMVLGGSGDDRLSGNAGDDTLIGGLGDDIVWGDSSDDRLSGNDGNDRLEGGEGNDILWGDAGNDTLVGGFGGDRMEGGDGTDAISGNAGNDILIGGVGADSVWADDGDDMISGNEDGDRLEGMPGNDFVWGDAGNDTIIGGTGLDRLEGGEGDDLVAGNEDSDTLSGGIGSDTLYGDDGADLLSGNDGNDRLEGGAGNDLLWGDANDDTLVGGISNDRAEGGEGNDAISGNEGADTLIGGVGNDSIWGDDGHDDITGGLGIDLLAGGAGADLFRFFSASESAPTTPDVITDFVAGSDKIDLSLLDGNAAAELSLIDGGAFSTIGQVRVVTVAGGVQLEANLVGDLTAEFVIFVAGIVSVTAADLLL